MGPEFIIKLTCETCGKRGIAVWGDPHPVFKHREIQKVTEGFVLVDAGVPGDPHLECGFCRVPCEHLGHADRKRSA